MIWNPCPILRRRGTDRVYVKYAGLGTHIIIVFSSPLGMNGYLSILEKRKNTIPKRYRFDNQEHSDTMYGPEYTASFRAIGRT